MAKYNITRIVPEGFLHTSAFIEVIDSLAWSLSALGHEVGVTLNWLSEHNETNIIFGAEVLADYQKLPRNSILFNLEQPSHPNMEKVRKLASGLTVWDFSPRNVKDWRERGYDVRHVPIGYTPNLTRIPKASIQDWDIFFCGWMTPRRVALIDALRSAGLKVFASAACYGGGRDNLISRSKVCLNVHHDGRDMFEIVRCSYLMANGKCIVSEESVDDADYSDLALAPTNYRALLSSCIDICKMDSVRLEIESHNLNAIRKRDFTRSVEAALDGPQQPQTISPLMQELSKLGGSGGNGAAVSIRYERGCAEGDMSAFLPWLRSHARGNILEIGVRDGASTSAFLLGLEEHGGHLYSLDVQPAGHLFPGHPHSLDVQDASHLFPGHPHWTFLHHNSTDLLTVLKQIPFELDLILIDGDHSRAGVLADFQYARQLRPGGMVLFHDIRPEEKPSGCTDMSWPSDDVKNVFEELSAALSPQGWGSEILPGRYGMGVLYKPALPVTT